MTLTQCRKYMVFRLRYQLLTEEELFEEEFKQRMRMLADDGIKKRQERLLTLRAERERQREQFVEEKKMQQLL